jgi:predicted nucleotidyltransferase
MLAPIHPAIESHYVETEEGLFFAVKGLIHPPDRIVAILRYIPDPNGDRLKEGQHYSRLYHFPEQVQYLQEKFPQYLAFEPTIQATLQSVPSQSIRRIFDPRHRLEELFDQVESDPLELDAVAFAEQLYQASGLPRGSVGISGSLLIRLHLSKSDLDLTVHGDQNCRSLHQALRQMLGRGGSDSIDRLDEQGMELLFVERSTDTQMAHTTFVRSERNKVIQGQFRGRTYFLRFLKEIEEIGETYGSHRFIPEGKAEIQAVINDDRDAIFTPCRYGLGDVRFLQGPESVHDLREIVSFRGRFCEQAWTGEVIQAYGTLERVEDRSGDSWHRLLLGNNVEDTMFSRGEP